MITGIMMKKLLLFVALCLVYAGVRAQDGQKTGGKPYNVVFILSDDHRYDFMGFMKKVPGLETPHMDRMAREGAHLENAFVSTALCSPSRASILTGQYAHTQDRKSTRLNSSHVKISYTVFCLR